MDSTEFPAAMRWTYLPSKVWRGVQSWTQRQGWRCSTPRSFREWCDMVYCNSKQKGQQQTLEISWGMWRTQSKLAITQIPSENSWKFNIITIGFGSTFLLNSISISKREQHFLNLHTFSCFWRFAGPWLHLSRRSAEGSEPGRKIHLGAATSQAVHGGSRGGDKNSTVNDLNNLKMYWMI